MSRLFNTVLPCLGSVDLAKSNVFGVMSYLLNEILNAGSVCRPFFCSFFVVEMIANNCIIAAIKNIIVFCRLDVRLFKFIYK